MTKQESEYARKKDGRFKGEPFLREGAKEIRHLQNDVLLRLKAQLADAKGLFIGKDRKALSGQIQQTEQEIAAKLDKLPDILKKDGYPDVQAFMWTFREMESVVEQYNRNLAEWERQTGRKSQTADKQQPRPPERESVLKRLHQIQAESKRRNQLRQREKSVYRDSR